MNNVMTSLAAAIAMWSLAGDVSAQVPTDKTRGNMRVEVDSIDFRADLTRVYCRVLGRPHTAQRIDHVTLNVAGSVLAAREIDGVDFERYFQWEDDGVRPVEIDFAPTQISNTAEISMSTVYGAVKSLPTPLDEKGRARK